jgi:V-type H+-transporting ATPase subunit a
LYKLFLNKEKQLFASLNKFKKGDKLFMGFCWIPKCEQIDTFKLIEGIKEKNQNIDVPTFKLVPDHGIKPPTFFKLNAVTAVYQEIVNTYGIPSYKEVNPTVFTVVTFPFLYGIMFGDIGHGSVVFAIGSVLCLFNPFLKERFPSMGMVLEMRYLLLMLGFFATFCGLCYNDFMSIPLFLFDSCYPLEEAENAKHMNETVEMIQKPDCVYPIGIDPAWYMSKNELNYMNSLKMKISVILGVLQMSLGVCMKAANALYNKNKLDFYLEFLP